MNNQSLLILNACLLLFGAASAETVPETIKKAGLQDSIGTTPDQAGAADSLAFPNLPTRTYWMTKHTFNKVTEAWNNARITEAEGGTKAPLCVSDLFRDMLRNEYMHALNKAWPTITEAKHGAGATRIKKIITDGDPDADEKTAKPGPNDAPNPKLAIKIRAFYDEWLLKNEAEPDSVFQRFADPLVQEGGAKLLGASRDFALFEVRLVGDNGDLAPNPKLVLRVTKPNLWGMKTEREVYVNPVRLAVPVEVYEVEAFSGEDLLQKETIIFKKGETVSREFSKKGQTAPSTPAATKQTSVIWEMKDEATALQQYYAQKLGPAAVLPYDAAPALARLAAFPESSSEIMRSYGLSGRWGLPWWRARRGDVVDGSEREPNPAINDGCLNIRFEADKLKRFQPDADLSGLKLELEMAVVDWANAFTGESVTPIQPISSFAVNEEFFSRLTYRARAEAATLEKTLQPQAKAMAHFGRITVKCFDFVRWEMTAHNDFVASVQAQGGTEKRRSVFDPSARGGRGRDFGVAGTPSFGDIRLPEKPPGKADNDIDLIIRFVDTFSIGPQGDAVAVFMNTDAHKGVIEVLAKAEWAFLAKAQSAPANAAKSFSFRKIMLHELGHYFGLSHLPKARDGHAFLEPCVMCSKYSKTFDAVTPADAAMSNGIEYLSLDIRGRVCAGLSSE